MLALLCHLFLSNLQLETPSVSAPQKELRLVNVCLTGMVLAGIVMDTILDGIMDSAALVYRILYLG